MADSFDLPPLPEPFVSLKTAQFAIGENVTSGLFTADQMQAYARAAVEAEREACAKLCESLFDKDDDSCNEAETCSAAIRARGKS